MKIRKYIACIAMVELAAINSQAADTQGPRLLQDYKDAGTRVIYAIKVLWGLGINWAWRKGALEINAGTGVGELPPPPEYTHECITAYTESLRQAYNSIADMIVECIYALGMGELLQDVARKQPLARQPPVKKEWIQELLGDAMSKQERMWNVSGGPRARAWHMCQAIKAVNPVQATPISPEAEAERLLSLEEYEEEIGKLLTMLRISEALKIPVVSHLPGLEIRSPDLSEGAKTASCRLTDGLSAAEIRAIKIIARECSLGVAGYIREEAVSGGMGAYLNAVTGQPLADDDNRIRRVQLRRMALGAAPAFLARKEPMDTTKVANWYLLHDIGQVTGRRDQIISEDDPISQALAETSLLGEVAAVTRLAYTLKPLGNPISVHLPWRIKKEVEARETCPGPVDFMPAVAMTTSEALAAIAIVRSRLEELCDGVWVGVAKLGQAASLEAITGLPPLARHSKVDKEKAQEVIRRCLPVVATAVGEARYPEEAAWMILQGILQTSEPTQVGPPSEASELCAAREEYHKRLREAENILRIAMALDIQEKLQLPYGDAQLPEVRDTLSANTVYAPIYEVSAACLVRNMLRCIQKIEEVVERSELTALYEFRSGLRLSKELPMDERLQKIIILGNADAGYIRPGTLLNRVTQLTDAVGGVTCIPNPDGGFETTLPD